MAAADNDDDGFNARIDCNDGNAAIRPGVVVSRNIDENCDGADSITPGSNPRPATEQVIVTVAFFASAARRRRSSRRFRSRTSRSARPSP